MPLHNGGIAFGGGSGGGGGFPPNDLTTFTSESTESGVKLNFSGPEPTYIPDSDGAAVFAAAPRGVMIRYSTEGYPLTEKDGVLGYDFNPEGEDWNGTETNTCTVVGLTNNTKYYFTAFPYSDYGVFNRSESSKNRTEMTWVGNKGTISVNVQTPAGYTGTLGEYTITLVDQAIESPQNIEQTFTGPGVKQIGNLEGGKTYKVRLSETSDLRQTADSDAITVVGGHNHEVTMTYAYKYGSLTVNIGSDYGVNPVGQVTVTLTPTAGGSAKTQSRQGTGAVSFTNVDVGTYTMAVSKVDLYSKPSNKSVTIVGGKTITENVTLASSKNMEEYSVAQIANIFRAGKGSMFPVGSSKTSNVYRLNLNEEYVLSSPTQMDLVLCEILDGGKKGRFATKQWASSDTFYCTSGSPIENKFSSLIQSLRNSMFPEWAPYMVTSTTTYTTKVPATTYSYEETQHVHYFSRSQMSGGISYFNSNSRRRMETEGAYFLLDSRRDDQTWSTYIVDNDGAVSYDDYAYVGLVVNFVIG